MNRLLIILLLLLTAVWPAEAMQRRQQYVFANTGRVIPGATVTVYLTGTTTKATIYSDNGVTSIANPVTVNTNDGSYIYYVANGRYDETVVASGFTFAAPTTADVVMLDMADAIPALTVSGRIIATSNAGPHKFGTGDATADATTPFLINMVVTGSLNSNAWGFISALNFTKFSAGQHPVVVGAELDFPHVVGGAATINELNAVRIGADGAAPYAAANIVYALNVSNGVTKLAGENASLTRPALRLPNQRPVVWYDTSDTTTNSTALYNDSSNRLNVLVGLATQMQISTLGVLQLLDNTSGTTLRQVAASVTFDVFNNGGGGFVRTTTAHPLALGANGSTRLTITSAGILLVGSAVAGAAAADTVVLANNKPLSSVTSGGATVSELIRLAGTDVVHVNPSADRVIALGVPGTTANATVGDYVIPNAHAFRSSLADASDTRKLLELTSGNVVLVGGSGSQINLGTGGEVQWGKALVALGGGAAPTFGTIGGSGPATAAQNTWMRVLDSTGAAFWVPAWK